MTRIRLLAAALLCSAAVPLLAQDAPAPEVPAPEVPAPEVDEAAGTDTVPMPKQVKHRAIDFRPPLPTELPVIWPPMYAPGPPGGFGPHIGPGEFGPHSGPHAGPVGPRVLGPLDDLHGFEEPLWPHVRYEDRDNVAPHAVPQIVAVKHPGERRDGRHCCLSPAPACDVCGPGYVLVEICVPRCRRPEIDVKRKDESKIEFDFGDYEVEITSKDGWVTVDYDD